MLIPFKSKVNIKDLRQAPYLIFKRDRDAIDSILNLIKKTDL
jgi:hypothetical protein